MRVRDLCARERSVRAARAGAGGHRNKQRPATLGVNIVALGLLVVPAAEVAGRPTRGRGVALERRVAATGPALGGVPGSEATRWRWRHPRR